MSAPEPGPDGVSAPEPGPDGVSAPEPGYPSWLGPLLLAVNTVRAEDLSQIPVPADGTGRRSAVLVLLAGQSLAEADVLLIERASTLRSHAGQVAFPGGATDPDDQSAADTALRESAEEVGLRPETVTVLAELPSLFLPPSQFLVSPVLGYWSAPHEVGVLDAGEVASVARVPLVELRNPSNRFTVRLGGGYRGPAFEAGGLFIWGFTGGLLSALLRLGGLELPWDARVERAVPG